MADRGLRLVSVIAMLVAQLCLVGLVLSTSPVATVLLTMAAVAGFLVSMVAMARDGFLTIGAASRPGTLGPRDSGSSTQE